MITAEADVLLDEGEAYAKSVIHDFVMLNALRGTNAAEAAIDQAVAVLKQALRD